MAVYTHVSDEALAIFLAQYDIGQAISFKGIAEGVENSNYLLNTDQASFILTLYEKRVDPTDLPFFIDLMDHLAAKGIPCPTPVHNRAGDALGTLEGRPCAIISFLDGMAVERPKADHCAALGSALAKFHLAAADFPGHRTNALSVSGWRELVEMCLPRADEIDRDLGPLIHSALDSLEDRWPTDLPQGVIHADLFPDNVFFTGGALSGLIDFYFACNDALAYDLAICLNAWCFEADGSFNLTKSARLIQAYQAQRPLDAHELAALPTLAAGAALRFLLTRTYDYLNQVEGAVVRPKNPLEFTKKLRFHLRVENAGEYGA